MLPWFFISLIPRKVSLIICGFMPFLAVLTVEVDARVKLSGYTVDEGTISQRE